MVKTRYNGEINAAVKIHAGGDEKHGFTK